MRWFIVPLLSVMLLGLPVAAQEAPPGGDENYVTPGMEGRAPSAAPLEGDDVHIFTDYDGTVAGFVSIPDRQSGVLVQEQGRDWRAFRSGWFLWIAGGLILLTVGALAAFFFWRGRIRIESGRSGRWVPRFNGLERFAHWATAISFLALAITGLIITFGRPLLIPLMGHAAFTPLAEASKTLHNIAAPPFVIGIVMMLVLWLRDNIPNRTDIEWLRQAGGMFSAPGTPHPEAERFNAGQKMIFWIVTLGGLLVSATGLVLLMPFFFADIGGMQVAQVVHALTAAALIAVIIAHIYLGTLGMEGAFDAMGRGEVDENWAREHHSGWYKTLKRPAPDAPAPTDGKGVPAE
ncbi:formate dehydrogenase subunit gamma [Halodurantibacterium flavum]|uniref:Formate dehydrogenase subunit gamma n=1 Tax=Halodurantibacterium flavum TaxID=1382802 RepID=A0ABW4S607_9RHOB